jgi:hypothetical protein
MFRQRHVGLGVPGHPEGLTKVRKYGGRHIKPLRVSTIRGRRAKLQAAARMAVKAEIPIEEVDSLRSMLKQPKIAEKILDAYWHVPHCENIFAFFSSASVLLHRGARP